MVTKPVSLQSLAGQWSVSDGYLRELVTTRHHMPHVVDDSGRVYLSPEQARLLKFKVAKLVKK